METKSWNRRMAEQLAALDNDNLSEDILETVLEGAGEIKAVRLKILLGRCYEIIAIARANQEIPCSSDEFENEILEELK